MTMQVLETDPNVSLMARLMVTASRASSSIKGMEQPKEKGGNWFSKGNHSENPFLLLSLSLMKKKNPKPFHFDSRPKSHRPLILTNPQNQTQQEKKTKRPPLVEPLLQNPKRRALAISGIIPSHSSQPPTCPTLLIVQSSSAQMHDKMKKETPKNVCYNTGKHFPSLS